MAWPDMRIWPCVSGSFSPEATRSCHSTRSRPVIDSVTGCSTCRRVFISMKYQGASAVSLPPSTRNSTVPAPS